MKKPLIAAALAALSMAAQADVTVKDAWARGTTPAQKVTGAFMELTSSEDAALIAVASPVAGMAEIHAMKMENGVMKMRPLPRLALPAGKTVKLAPRGSHVMLMDLGRQLKPGDVLTLMLKVEGKNGRTQVIEAKARVIDLAAPIPTDRDRGRKY